VDIHCVTRWSKFDTNWRGGTLDRVFAARMELAGQKRRHSAVLEAVHRELHGRILRW
jgi:hypothetical protein